MSSVSEIVVREFFELHGFFVRQLRKHVGAIHRDEDEIDLLVMRPGAEGAGGSISFLLTAENIVLVTQAIVAIKGWHTDIFNPSVLRLRSEQIFRFASDRAVRSAIKMLGRDGQTRRILVLPSLPTSKEARDRSIMLLKQGGVDNVLLFGTVLEDLIFNVEVNKNYQRSDLLQMIRLLKIYGLLRDSQLDLFSIVRPKRKRKKETSLGLREDSKDSDWLADDGGSADIHE
jgi:hypothetical protein